MPRANLSARAWAGKQPVPLIDESAAMRRIVTFFRDEQAATSVEYAVMLALILMAVLGAIGSVGARSGGVWSAIANSIDATP